MGYDVQLAQGDLVEEGQWVQPRRHGYRMICCDCGLVHRVNFRLIKSVDGKRNTIQFQAFRTE